MVNPAFVEGSTPSLFAHAFPEREVRADVEQLVTAYGYLCRRGARKFWRPGLERCDLEQVAAIGLIKAARRFEPASNTPFEAYAWLTMVGELMHHVRDHERAVRTPRRLRSLEQRLARARDACATRFGREPSDGELAAELGIEERTVAEVRRATASAIVLPLDDPAAHALASRDDLDPEDRLLVADAFARLSATERRIVIAVDVLGITQLEIGKALGLSAKRVSRMRRTALGSMQRAWAS